MNPPFNIRLNRKDRRRFGEIAENWNTLQNFINTMDEEELLKLLVWELKGKRRLHFLNRLKSKHNRLRDVRERAELFGDVRVRNRA